MKKVLLLVSLLFSLNVWGQVTLDGSWQLESISRNQKSLEFYNRDKDAADGYPPVLWKVSGNTLAITGDLSVTATDPHAQDTVEAHHYTLSGDTLILTQYYTKGLELATITNSKKTYYRLEELTPESMLLIMYDRYYDGKFRTIDVYSRRYVFSKIALAKELKVAPVSVSLFNKVKELDSLLFSAYNKQDMPNFKPYFTTDLEWYQDNGGLINYTQVFTNFQTLFNNENKLTRELVKGTLEVYPIKDYGAVEIGTHQFKHIENGQLEIGTFKFIMVWRNNNGDWKISRVISYDH